MKRALVALFVVGLLIPVAVGVWAATRGSTRHPVVKHHATCWAHPGVFAQVDGRWVARYTATGSRHGKGSTAGVCGA